MLHFPVCPRAAIERLKKALVTVGEFMSVESGCNIPWGEGGDSYIYVFLEGGLVVKRADDKILFSDVHEAHVFGLMELFQPLRINILQARTKCLVVRVNGRRAIKEIEKNNLWKDVISILNFHVEYVMCREMLLMNHSALSIVCHYLEVYNGLSEEIKSCTNLHAYIKERTGLSKSSIVNSIRKLKKGNYIGCKRGGVDLHIYELPFTFNDGRN